MRACARRPTQLRRSGAQRAFVIFTRCLHWWMKTCAQWGRTHCLSIAAPMLWGTAAITMSRAPMQFVPTCGVMHWIWCSRNYLRATRRRRLITSRTACAHVAGTLFFVISCMFVSQRARQVFPHFLPRPIQSKRKLFCAITRWRDSGAASMQRCERVSPTFQCRRLMPSPCNCTSCTFGVGGWINGCVILAAQIANEQTLFLVHIGLARKVASAWFCIRIQLIRIQFAFGILPNQSAPRCHRALSIGGYCSNSSANSVLNRSSFRL